MLLDIFAAFDPDTNMLHPTMKFWFMALCSIMLLSSPFWLQMTRTSSLWSFPASYMLTQVSRTFATNISGTQMILVPLFSFLIFLNLCGLIPYVFSLTSHLVFSLSFGAPLWLTLIISGAFSSPKKFLAHLLPSGAPAGLSAFLIIVETLSTIVRPITLSFRLTANMSAGHIVLTLLGIYLAASLISPNLSTLPLLALHIGYTLFEVGISLIQAYIFCLLLTLYADDHPSHWASANLPIGFGPIPESSLSLLC